MMHTGRFWDPDSRKHTSGEGPGDRAYSAFPIDWDADGDIDLLVGTSGGGMYLRMNEGTKKKPAFAETLVDTGSQVPGGYAMPVAADWDGDGRWDLVSGSQDGAIYWFRNVGKAGRPKLEAPRQLVAASGGGYGGSAGKPGRRTQVDVADFDGDGDTDLLAGDMRYERKDKKTVWHGFVWLHRRAGSPKIGTQPAAGPARTAKKLR